MMVRLAGLGAVVALLACSESSSEQAPLESASVEDLQFEPEKIDVCIDGLDKPHGHFVVRNVSARRFDLIFDPVNARVSARKARFEPFASTTIEVEPVDSEGSVVVLDDARSSRLATVRFGFVFDVRLLTVRAEGSDVFVTNPSSFALPLEPLLEGAATFVAVRRPDGAIDDGSTLDHASIAPAATMQLRVQRTGSGSVRVSFGGARCSQGDLRELPVIDIP
jgi:hypothetical protein